LLFDLDSRSNTSVRPRTPTAKDQSRQKLGVLRRASTHDRILTQGIDILSLAGFSGVTLGVLAQRVGISKSGLFAHFKSIEQVQLAILQHVMDVWTANVLAPSMLADEGLPRLLSYFLHWLGWTSKAGLSGGCPLAAALFELDDKQGPLRITVAIKEKQWRSVLVELIEEAIHFGHLSRDTNVPQLTCEIWGIYLTHHVSARFLCDDQANEQAQSAFERLIAGARSK
jgi:AcrR family transcriptional regulator